MFVHIVLFWLKDGSPVSAKQNLLHDCREILAKIPTVKKLDAGSPALTPRAVVDNSYSVGLSVIFDDKAGHDTYQDHPLHQQFIARNKDHWQRVQVYDFV